MKESIYFMGLVVILLVIFIGNYVIMEQNTQKIIKNQEKILKQMEEYHPYKKTRQEIKRKMHNITITE